MKKLKHLLSSWAPEIEWVHDPAQRLDRRMILDGDACLPYKKMVRTALSLVGQVDFLIAPRIVKVDGFLMCPNFRALPDLVSLNRKRLGLAKDDSLITPVMEGSESKEIETLAREIYTGMFGRSPRNPTGPAIEQPLVAHEKSGRDMSRTVALIGHPYLLADAGLNNSVPEILRANGFEPLFAHEIPFQVLTDLAAQYDYYAKTLYWRSAREALGAFLYFSRRMKPAGVIHLVAFNCGVDALLRVELAALHKRMANAPPFMVIVCDEHTQKDHVVTRVEAFLDMIHGIRIN